MSNQWRPSNGTEFALFSDIYCDNCKNNRDPEDDDQCAILLDMAVEGSHPAVVYDDRGLFSDGVGRVFCREFCRKAAGLRVVTDEEWDEWQRLNRRANQAEMERQDG